MSNPMKGSPTALRKRLRHNHQPHRKRPLLGVQQSIHLPPPPPEPHFTMNFNHAESRRRVTWPPVKTEPMHATDSVAARVPPGSLGSAERPIMIDVPPSLEDIKRATLPATARSNYVRHSEMTKEEAKERRRQQNRASARRTRQKTRHHIDTLEASYRDLRQKYTKLRSLYLKIAGPNAQLPTFQDPPAGAVGEGEVFSDDDDDDQMPQMKSEERMETSPDSKRRKKMRKDFAKLQSTVSQQATTIENLENQLRANRAENGKLQSSLVKMSSSCAFPPELNAGAPLFHQPQIEDVKPNLPSPPPINVGSNVSPPRVVDGDVEMAHPDSGNNVPPTLPRLEMGEGGSYMSTAVPVPNAFGNDFFGNFGCSNYYMSGGYLQDSFMAGVPPAPFDVSFGHGYGSNMSHFSRQ